MSQLREIIERRLSELTTAHSERVLNGSPRLHDVVVYRLLYSIDILKEVLAEADGEPMKLAKEENVRRYACPWCGVPDEIVGGHRPWFYCKGCGRRVMVDESTFQIEQ